MRRLISLLIAVLAIALCVLLLRGNAAVWSELTALDASSIETRIVALLLLAIVVLALFRQRFPNALQSAAVWALIALVLVLAYTYRFELRDVSDRVLAELIPGRAVSRGHTVEIARGTGGGFAVATQVNGARIAMVLDTGASAVVLTQEAARTAGLPLEVLNYSVHVDTANGRARAAPVTLDKVSIGGITERSVPALIAQGGLRTNLLGMSFLNRLQSWEVRGDRLVLRGYP